MSLQWRQSQHHRLFAKLRTAMQTSIRLKSVLVLFTFAIVPNLSHAAETVFGLKFDQPVQLSPCEGNELYPYHPKEDFCITQLSLRNLAVDDGGSTGMVDALFKEGDLPFWTLNRLKLLLVKDRLVGIVVKTRGHMTHLSVTSDLTVRFGKPTSKVQRTAQNQMGASFDNTITIWQVGNLSVTYTPLLGDTKTGQVDVFLPTGLTLYRKLLVEKNPTPSRPL